MKHLILVVAVASVGMVAEAQSLPAGLYMKADAGGTITEKTSLKEFFGDVAPGSKVEFDPGARFSVGIGYELTDYFAVEGEFAGMSSSISSITDAERVDAWFSNIPFLINAKLQLPRNRYYVTPYLGGGVGGSAAIIDVHHIDLNGTHLDGSDATAVFAYQGFAGVRFWLNETMGLSVEYRYFGTTAPEWSADHAHDVDTDKLKFGDIHTHAFSIAFDWKF
jgi:opacity protein-like surface antigen